MRPLYEHGASALATLVAQGEASSRDVVECHLERIRRFNPGLGAVTRALEAEALQVAERQDREGQRGPLVGVPFTVKENIDCFGSPTTSGVRAARDLLPYRDAPVVERLRAAGAILIARGNLSEMGLRLCTTNPLHGRTLNPFDRGLTVGGSSGGDAAAVAVGMAPFGVGGDIGGSLRVPAQCCGVATLKPTPGRIPIASSVPPEDRGLASQLMLSLGPLARCVRDLRLFLTVTAGRDARDPHSIDVPLEGPRPDAQRVALVTTLPGGPLPAPARDAIAAAGRILESKGYLVEEASPPELASVAEVFEALLAADIAVVAEQIRPVVSEALYEHLARLCRLAPRLSGHRLHLLRNRLLRTWSGFFSEYHVVVGPNWAVPFWGVDADIDPAHGPDLLRRTVRFMTPGNALGLPAVTLPMGFEGGLPVAVQIYADRWREDLCLRAAEVVEQSVGEVTPIEF